MSYPINYPTPQGANIQYFYGSSKALTANTTTSKDWVKPQGASFVWFTLIGAGSSGDGTNGGSSGAVTNFMCPAFLIPDILQVNVGSGGTNSVGEQGVDTTVVYQAKDGTGYTLLTAKGTGSASTSNFFSAMGFFQSVAGQSGTNGADQPASTTTFLSGGTQSFFVVNGNYGYSTPASGNVNGFFQMQPIIVGVGGSGNGRGGLGCGGGLDGVGGAGLAVIITW